MAARANDEPNALSHARGGGRSIHSQPLRAKTKHTHACSMATNTVESIFCTTISSPANTTLLHN
eukprot:scaffold16331_cov73-Skeletonema_marinoi.AAC.2